MGVAEGGEGVPGRVLLIHSKHRSLNRYRRLTTLMKVRVGFCAMAAGEEVENNKYRM